MPQNLKQAKKAGKGQRRNLPFTITKNGGNEPV